MLTDSPIWLKLGEHCKTLQDIRIADLHNADRDRLHSHQMGCEGLELFYGFQRTDGTSWRLLHELARERSCAEELQRMVRGETINTTEHRAVLHTALRQGLPEFTPPGVQQDVCQLFQRMEKFVGDVREGRLKGKTGKQFRHIVNIGIGGSDLGPRLCTEALQQDNGPLKVHFVANADGYELLQLMRVLDPETTLILVISKTFTTEETLLNAKIARTWVEEKLGPNAVHHHFAAVSLNQASLHEFGIPPHLTFPLWDWVGGRFSVWSAVGLSLALAIGFDAFTEFRRGGASLDRHVFSVPAEKNLSLTLALLTLWNATFLNARAHAILPYTERLREFPRYLQQLEMESNGKSVTQEERPVTYGTSPIIFGDCGTVSQHSFHQYLHQGTDLVSVDFIAVRQNDEGSKESYQSVNRNLAAQATALAFGSQTEEGGLSQQYRGNKPSVLVSVPRLSPFHLGQLLALYEHKTFYLGVLWGLNSFDQPGVELGKRLARSLVTPTTQGISCSFYLKALYDKLHKS